MRIFTNKINEITTKAYVMAQIGTYEVIQKLKEKDGSMFTDNAMNMIIGLTVAALVLVGVTALFKDIIGPAVTDKVKAIF